MRRLRVAAALATLGTAFIACGDDDNSPSSTPRDGGTGDGGIEATPLEDATPPDEDAGAFTIVDIADTPCPIRATADKTVFANARFDAVSGLSAIGARRIAQRSSGTYLVDADGSNPSATAIAADTMTSAALDDGNIASLSTNGSGPLLNILDANGTPKVTNAPGFDNAGFGLSAAGGGGIGLVAFGTQFGAYARGIAPAGWYADSFILAPFGAFENFRASVARKPDNSFGVAMSGDAPTTNDESRLSFVRASTTNRLAAGFNLEIGKTPRRVVQLVAREKGWALLLDYGKSLSAHVVLLDEQGHLDGPVFRLVGAGRGYGLGTSGGELGVFALHDPTGAPAPDAGDPDSGQQQFITGYAAFRPLDAKGAALGDWVCLGDGVDAAGIAGAILGEDNGYTVMYPRANGDAVLGRIGRKGN